MKFVNLIHYKIIISIFALIFGLILMIVVNAFITNQKHGSKYNKIILKTCTKPTLKTATINTNGGTLANLSSSFMSHHYSASEIVQSKERTNDVSGAFDFAVKNRMFNVTPHLNAKRQGYLSRAKRYLAFPEGSSFTVSVCFTVGIVGNPRYDYMSFGLNWGVAYDLPNVTWVLNSLHGFNAISNGILNNAGANDWSESIYKRRSRRAVYQEIELAIDNMGFNGRACILRALCESRHYFQESKLSMIGEMLRIVFSLPKMRIFTRELQENKDILIYDRAYRKTCNFEDCSTQYECPFSLLELVFGGYIKPTAYHYKNPIKAM